MVSKQIQPREEVLTLDNPTGTAITWTAFITNPCIQKAVHYVSPCFLHAGQLIKLL